MEFGSLDDGGNDEDNGVGFLEISEIFVRQDSFFFKTESFDRLYIRLTLSWNGSDTDTRLQQHAIKWLYSSYDLRKRN